MRNPRRHVYGPVPSWRLGRSLGVDVVPPKLCTYDCVYCQLGRTSRCTLERSDLVPVSEVLDEVEDALADGPGVDFVTIAGSGEPTLHSYLAEIVRGVIERTVRPVALLTNGSLLGLPQVREACDLADLVLPSLDAGDEATFRRVNRPHADLSFAEVVEGLAAFVEGFAGEVWLEVLLVEGITGIEREVEKIAGIVSSIDPDRVQLGTVTRPAPDPAVRAVPIPRLQSFGGFFTVPVDVVGVGPPRGGGLDGTSMAEDDEILALLRRRPETVRGVAAGLGIPPAVAAKELAELQRRSLVRAVPGRPATFYEAT